MDGQAGLYKFEVKSNKTRLRGKFQKYPEQSKTHLKRSVPPHAKLMIATVITFPLLNSPILKIIDILHMLRIRYFYHFQEHCPLPSNFFFLDPTIGL